MKKKKKLNLPIIAFAILAVGLFLGAGIGKASAATYYVKWDATGSGNGSSFVDAFTTVQSAVNAAISGTSGNYNVVEISGGASGHTYVENVTAAKNYVEMKQSQQMGHSGTVLLSGSGTGYAFSNGSWGYWRLTNLSFTSNSTTNAAVSTWKTIYNNCIFKDVVNISGRFNDDTLNNCRITNSGYYGGGVPMLYLAGGTSRFNNCIIEQTGYGMNIASTASAIFNNCVFSGNTQILNTGSAWTSGSINFNNCIIYANTAIASNGTGYLMHNASSQLITMTNCVIQGNPRAVDTAGNHNNYFDVGITDGGGNIYNSPNMLTPRADGMIGFEIDDTGNLNAWTQVSDYANTKGVGVAFALSGALDLTSTDWDTLALYAQRGNKINAHSLGHFQMTKYATQRLQITNTTGTSPTVAIAIDQTNVNPALWTGVLTLKENSSVVASFDLTSPLYKNLDLLKIAIANVSGGRWVATYESSGTAHASSLTLKGMSDTSCSSTLNLNFEDNLIGSTPVNRLWYYEAVYDKKIIEDNLSSRIPGGYIVDSFTYPGTDNNASFRSFLTTESNFAPLGLQAYESARAGGNSNPLENWDSAQVQSLQIDKSFTYANLPNSLNWFIDYVRYWGMSTILFAHPFSEWSLDGWKTVIDTVVASGVPIKSISQMRDHVAGSGLWTTSDNVVFSRIYDKYNVNFLLAKNSPAIDAGVLTSSTTDFINNPIYGTPDIGGYEFQPPHTIGTNEIDIAAGARIYGDGKFRDLQTTSSNTADLSVAPESGNFSTFNSTDVRPEWLNITDITWTNTGNHQKAWTESSSIGAINTLHTIGDLEANKNYNISVDTVLGQNIEGANGTTCAGGICKSNSEGKISFLYTGGYSEHDFEVIEGDNVAPTTIVSINTGAYNSTQNITLTCDDGAGVGCDKIYFTTDGTDPTTSSTQYSTPIEIVTTTTLKFFSTDLNGNQEAVQTKTYTIDTTFPIITIDQYNQEETDQDITVTASTNEGTLNSTTHTFTENGSFDFIATDDAGNITTQTVTITNIDKTPKVIANIKPKLFSSDNRKSFSATLKSDKVKLKNTNPEIANGKVQIKKGDRIIKEISVDQEGKWSTTFSSKKFRLHYLDQDGTEIATSKEYELKIDDEKPKIKPLAPIYVKHRGSIIDWEASDNKGIDYYTVKFENKTFKVKGSQIKIQSSIKKGAQTFIVTAYDKAGNKAFRKGNLVVSW